MSLEITLTGKRVLVTGGGSGIGRALCQRLHAQGALVTALCINPEWLASLSAECPGIQTICVDLEDWDATRKAISSMPEPMDCLVNNAGIGIQENFMETKPESFDKTMNINVKAIINVSQIIAQKMMDHKISGSIVNISSLSSRCGTRFSVVYNLSKAAVDMLTKSMAVELGPKGIRVNSINPMIIVTPISRPFFEGGAGQTVKDRVVARTPLGRIVEMDEAINTILFLLSSVAPMITGESIFIDGGYSVS